MLREQRPVALLTAEDQIEAERTGDAQVAITQGKLHKNLKYGIYGPD